MAETFASHDFLGPPSQAGDLGTIAHYRVIDELGKGGMGYVFRAEDSKLRRRVALKVMNQKIAATANSRRRFLHEARAMAAVHHDHVVTIFEVGESDGTPFMAMEMLQGGTLETFNQSAKRLDYEKIIEYAKQIARGLAAAHAKGIVHRDIKPANIWIEADKDRIKILDFGLALASTPIDHLSGRGAVIGTPGYLSPEQARSEPLDDRSDLYSLGVVLYELATGQLPLQASSVSGQLIAILAHRPKPIDQINPEIPKPLCDLIHKLLRKEPRLRPPSALALEAELERVRKECEAKSEVAQAINKLQVGLTQVVSQSEPESSIIDEISESIADPLTAIPPGGSGAFNSANSGRFVVPNTSAAKSATSSAPNWKLYAPLLAIVAIIVTVLPLSAFLFSRAGRSTDAIVTTFPSEATDPAKQKETYQELRARLAREANKREASKQQQLRSQQANADAGTTAEVDDHSRPANRSEIDQSGAANPSPAVVRKPEISESNPAVEPELESKSPQQTAKQTGTVKPAKTTEQASGTSSADAQSAPDAQPPAQAQPSKSPAPTPPPAAELTKPEPTPLLETIGILVSEGRGADVTVRKGAGDNLSDKPVISIRTRNEVEIEHTYLRFDLARIRDRAKIQSAELLLTAIAERPVGMTIRVHSIPKPPMVVWPENLLTWRTSLSEGGLDAYPVIAKQEIVVTKDQPKLIRFTDPALKAFLANAKEDVVTMILAGARGDEKVEFYSSEGSHKQAPRLLIRVTKPIPDPQATASNDRQAGGDAADVPELTMDHKKLLAKIRREVRSLRAVDSDLQKAVTESVQSGDIGKALEHLAALAEKLKQSNVPEVLKDRGERIMQSIRETAAQLQPASPQ